MPEISKDALFIIDGSYLLYRSFYAIKPLYTSTGVQTQAIYGFCRALKKIIDDFDPKYLVVAWDSKGPTFRTNIYAEYKATRQAPPSDLITQKNEIIEILKAIGICQAACQGYEADDVIYSLVKDFSEHQIVLVCPDKDLFQLLSPSVFIFDPFKGRLIDQATYEQEKGIPVAKIAFFYALLGDSSDNIPGVKGIGEKTALALVNQFASLEDLYAHVEQVTKDRIRQLLVEQRANAELSLRLFLFKYCALQIPFDALKIDLNKCVNAVPFFKKFEFASLLKELAKKFPDVLTVEQQMGIDQTGGQATSTPVHVGVAWECSIVENEQQLTALVAELKSGKRVAVDTETTGFYPLQDSLVGMSFAVDTQRAFYVPVGHTGEGAERQLPREKVLAVVKPILEDVMVKKVLHNAKFDTLIFRQYGVAVAGVVFDTMLAAHLIRNSWQKINLKDLSQFFLGEPMQTYEEVVGKTYKTFAQVPLDRASRYAAHDALQTLKLAPVFEQELAKNKKLEELFTTLEMPCFRILTEMEATGVMLDVDQLKMVAQDVERERVQVEHKFFAALEGVVNPLSFNLNSPKQVEWLLFDHLKLPVTKKSAGGQRSTDQEVLQELGLQSPVANLIVRYRELTKLKSTYLDALPTFINPKTHKIHTSYNQVLVATGRLSSSNPNLQNIPTGEEFGIKIREAFLPDSGYLFLSADYSQIELRVLAYLSQDENLMNAFLQNRDIHTQTAAQLFNVPLDAVTNLQRQVGKKINFSIVYGLTPYGLAKDLKIKPQQAKEYIDAYFAQYPKVGQWIEMTVAQAVELGYVQTVWGRRRYIPDLREKNKNLFEAARRVAINTPVQGTAADIMKLAMINVDRALKAGRLDGVLVLQIHDELVIQVSQDQAGRIQEVVRSEMEGVVAWPVPLRVTVRVGKSWGEVTK